MSLIDTIKKQANSNRTKIQSSEAVDLEKIFNAMFYNQKDIKEETKFIHQVMTRGLETQERTGLHASAMLKSDKAICLRAQVLSLLYKQAQGELEAVGLKRIFEEGNAIHEKWQRLLIRSGYGTAKDMDFTRFCERYKLSYTPDIICSIPKFFPGKMVGEIKSVNTFQFQKMVKENKKHPEAWKQCYWYMHLCIEEEKEKGIWNGIDYTKGFVLSDDKNTQEFKLEIYNYDPDIVKPFVERSEAIIRGYNKALKEHKMIKRPLDAVSPSCKRCETCFMREACWNIGKGKVRL